MSTIYQNLMNMNKWQWTPALATICLLSSCTASEPAKNQELTPDSLPVLQVNQGPYAFSMYPEYLSEEKSKLKLDIRDKQEHFVHATKLTAVLIAKDGHRQVATFVEDSSLEKYVAEIPLKHHEDYSIQTKITLREPPAQFTPTFSFHCCDPLPEMNDNYVETPKGDASK